MSSIGRTIPARAVSIVCDAIVLCAAILLLFAGFTKVLDAESFYAALRAHGLIPTGMVGPAADSLIALEVIAGMTTLFALLSRRRLWSGAIPAGCFLVFAAYALALCVDPPPAPTGCGCGLSATVVERWEPVAARSASACLVLAATCFRRGVAASEPPNVERSS